MALPTHVALFVLSLSLSPLLPVQPIPRRRHRRRRSQRERVKAQRRRQRGRRGVFPLTFVNPSLSLSLLFPLVSERDARYPVLPP